MARVGRLAVNRLAALPGSATLLLPGRLAFAACRLGSLPGRIALAARRPDIAFRRFVLASRRVVSRPYVRVRLDCLRNGEPPRCAASRPVYRDDGSCSV